jgi:hypothetical protein
MAAENSIEQSFKNWCKRHGYTRFKLKLDPGRGWPDQAVMLPGNRVVWIEFKSRRGVVAPQQEFIHAKLEKCGHVVFVCRSLEEAKDAITRISKSGS